MVAEQFAQSAEFGLSGVLLAEFKCLHGSALVHNFQSCIVPKDVQNCTVCLPQKLQPRCDNCSIGSVSGLFARDCGKKDRLRSLGSFQIVDAGSGGRGLEGGLNFIGLGLRGCDFLFCQFDEFLEDQL